MCIIAYKYVVGCIYTHYHGGYIFIWFGNFKKAGYTECNYSIFFIFWGTELYAQEKLRAAKHMLGCL